MDDRGSLPEARPLPRAQDVLDLPAEQVRTIEATDDRNAHRGAASDVVSVVLWAGAGPFTTTVADLAGRLRIPPADVRSTLHYAERAGLVKVREEGTLTLTVTAPVVRRCRAPRRNAHRACGGRIFAAAQRPRRCRGAMCEQ